MDGRNKDRPNDLVKINTGFGQLTAPKRIIDLWIRYGFPNGEVTREMTLNNSIAGFTLDERGQVTGRYDLYDTDEWGRMNPMTVEPTDEELGLT
jgi:hypothetical protein